MSSLCHTKTVNPKVLMIVIVAGLAGAVGIFTLLGSQFVDDVTGGFNLATSQIEVIPLEPHLEKIEVLSVTDEEAKIKVTFSIVNQNYKSVILQVLKYHLFASDVRVATEEIGERPEGMVAGSNYFTVIRGSPLVLDDIVTIKNGGNNPQLWSEIASNTVDWRVSGELYFNLSSMTVGHENVVPFEFSY
jgi:LEA14-like dessication related protein